MKSQTLVITFFVCLFAFIFPQISLPQCPLKEGPKIERNTDEAQRDRHGDLKSGTEDTDEVKRVRERRDIEEEKIQPEESPKAPESPKPKTPEQPKASKEPELRKAPKPPLSAPGAEDKGPWQKFEKNLGDIKDGIVRVGKGLAGAAAQWGTIIYDTVVNEALDWYDAGRSTIEGAIEGFNVGKEKGFFEGIKTADQNTKKLYRQRINGRIKAYNKKRGTNYPLLNPLK